MHAPPALRPSRFGRLILGLLGFFVFLDLTGVSSFPWASPEVGLVTAISLAFWGIERWRDGPARAMERLRGWLIWPALALLSESALQLISRLTPDVIDTTLANMDHRIGVEHLDRLLEPLRGPALTPLWTWAYASMFFSPLLLWFAARHRPKLRQTFLRAVLIIGMLGLVGYLLFPAVGPRFYFADSYHTDLYGAPHSAAEQHRLTAQAISDRAQAYYPRLAHRNCMPSLHTAWGILFLLMAARLGAGWLLLVAPLALGQIGATLVLRWHYMVDLLAGAPLAALAWLIADRLPARPLLAPRAPPARSPTARHGRLELVFGISGAAALLYELVSARALSVVFGGMADAIATVLATYMVGLSVGAFIGGRIADRIKRPIRLYATAELVIAGSVLLLPLGVDWVMDIYVSAIRAGVTGPSAVGLRVGLSALLLMPPTLAMGATLPLLVAHWMGRDPNAHRAVPRLYQANTLGAAVGVLAGTYLILPVLGLSQTLFMVAGLDLLAAMLAFNVARSQSGAPLAPAPPSSSTTPNLAGLRRPRILLLAVFVGSFALFALEVQWTHVLAVVVGNSAYAFGVMLFSVLVGLALGGGSAERIPKAKRSVTLAADAIFFAAVVGGGLLLWDQVPRLFHVLGFSVRTFMGRETVRFVVCLAMLVPPCFLSGRLFALALASYAAADRGVGRRVGRLSAASTVGAVIGSLTGSFVLLPRLGAEPGLRLLGVILLVCAGLYAAAVALSQRQRQALAGGAVLAALLLGLAPRWDIEALTDGSNVYFQKQWLSGHTVFVHEDKFGGLTTVREETAIPNPNTDDPDQAPIIVHTLLTNGKFQGNDRYEMDDQRAIALYPILHLQHFGRALVIGLGSGVSAAVVASFPFEKVIAAEISPGIIEAADRYFKRVNGDIVRRLGRDLKMVDGRQQLLVSEDQYDLISMEISSIWFAGASTLYTRDFYALAQQRLAPGGVLQQWIQLHHILRLDLAVVLRSLRDVFPHVQLYVGGHQGVLLASMTPFEPSTERLAAWCDGDPRFAAPCQTFGGDLRPYLKRRLLDTAGIDRFIAAIAKAAGIPTQDLVSTDDSLYLEYATPRGNVLPWDSGDRMISYLRTFQSP